MKIFASKRMLQLCVLMVALCGITATAGANTYNFNVDLTYGTVTGTLAGTVDFAFLSGTGAASSLVLTSIPAGFGSLAGGNTVTNWADQVSNTFTISGGVITSFDFFALTAAMDPADAFCLNSTGSANPFGSFTCQPQLNELHAYTSYGYNSNGLNGVQFEQLASTPESGSMLLLATGLAGLAGVVRRKLHR